MALLLLLQQFSLQLLILGTTVSAHWLNEQNPHEVVHFSNRSQQTLAYYINAARCKSFQEQQSAAVGIPKGMHHNVHSMNHAGVSPSISPNT